MPYCHNEPAPNRRRRVFLEADGLCTYCLGEMTYAHRLGGASDPKLHPQEVTIEHLHPREFGGSNAPSNLAGCCTACNNSKDNEISAEDFRALRRSLLDVWPPCTFPPLSVRRGNPGIRPVSRRFKTVFEDISKSGYWRRWFGREDARRIGLIWDRQNLTVSIRRRTLMEHLPTGRTRDELVWKWGPFRRFKLLKGRSAAYADDVVLLDYGAVWPWRQSVDNFTTAE